LTKLLTKLQSLEVSALEPSPAMLARLETKFPNIVAKEGFTDSSDDAGHFCGESFDVIISRQVVCGLYDPIQAFENWGLWLKPGGEVFVIDGLFSREGSGKWDVIADQLPLSCVQTLTLTPYLLERSGFKIRRVDWLRRTNHCILEQSREDMPSKISMRYVVVAEKTA
jgi:SAM-dependent methyltransferase